MRNAREYAPSLALLLHSMCLLLVVSGSHAYIHFQENICSESTRNSPMWRLRRTLFCDYDPTVRHTPDQKNSTAVSLRVALKKITINEYDSVADVHTWTILQWRDEHLTWDPTKYDDIKMLHVNSEEIWLPSISANDAYGQGSDMSIPYTNCWVSSDGIVKCIPPTMYSVPCIAEHVFWPYDFLYCSLELRTLSYNRDEVALSMLNGKGLYLNDYRKDETGLSEWDLLMTSTHEYLEIFPLGTNLVTESISMEFLLQRNSVSLAIISIAPVVALPVMTLVTLWMDVRSTERLLIASLNFVCHLLCMYDVHWKMPDSGLYPPHILSFYETSLILATIALILTSFLRHILKTSVQVPGWISSTTSSIFRSKFGQILLVSILDPKASATLEDDAEDGANLLQARNPESSWRYVVLVVGWLAFIATVLAYVVLFSVRIPTYHSGRAYHLQE